MSPKNCPACGSDQTRKSHRSWLERSIGFFLPFRPFRCRDCYVRHWGLRRPIVNAGTGILIATGVLTVILLAQDSISARLTGAEEPAGEAAEASPRPDAGEAPSRGEAAQVGEATDVPAAPSSNGGDMTAAAGRVGTEEVASDGGEVGTYRVAADPDPALVATLAAVESAPSTETKRPSGPSDRPAVQPASAVEQRAEKQRVEKQRAERTGERRPEPGRPSLPANGSVASADRDLVSVAEPLPRGDAPAPAPRRAVRRPPPPAAESPPPSGLQFRGVRTSRDGDSLRVDLLANRPVQPPSPLRYRDPDRWVLDFYGGWTTGVTRAYAVGHPLVERVRVGHHADKLRLVVDLTGNTAATPTFEASPSGLRITFRPARPQ